QAAQGRSSDRLVATRSSDRSTDSRVRPVARRGDALVRSAVADLAGNACRFASVTRRRRSDSDQCCGHRRQHRQRRAASDPRAERGAQSAVRRGVPQSASSGRRGTRLVSRSAAVRAAAARIVADVALRGRSLDAVLVIDEQATRQERGLLRALVYDSIRWYLRLDALLERLLARPGQKLDPHVRGLAIVGLCQLLYTEIPAHAAVAETVEAVRLLGHARAAGFINAVLRRCQREHAH